jgi:hypothetical protein
MCVNNKTQEHHPAEHLATKTCIRNDQRFCFSSLAVRTSGRRVGGINANNILLEEKQAVEFLVTQAEKG